MTTKRKVRIHSNQALSDTEKVKLSVKYCVNKTLFSKQSHQTRLQNAT